MRAGHAVLALLLVAGCGPETVRATGAPASPTASATARTSAQSATFSPIPTPTTGPTSTPSSTPRPTSTATATSAPSPSAAGVPALSACASEPALRSLPAGGTVPLLVVNDAGARRDLSALDVNGKRVFTRSLAPGDSYTQTARVGEVWVVSDPGGVCVAAYRASAPALLIVSATRNSLLPLYAIRGRVSDARSSSPLPGQTVFVWKPEESACANIGGAGAPGYVVSSITAADGSYGVYVTAGEYKVRVRGAAVGGVAYAAQWWRGRPAGTAGQCAAADVVSAIADLLAIDFALQPE